MRRHHLADLLPYALLVAAAVVAAPAPRAKPSKVWITGWDEPVGDGRFERRGDRLTITTIPGKGDGRIDPRLLRDVVGDFAAHVRVISFERRGSLITTAWSSDGRSWKSESCHCRLPPKLKLGVAADVRGPGTFKATFDQFQLMHLDANGRRLLAPAGH